jgi:hypothetical protein
MGGVAAESVPQWVINDHLVVSHLGGEPMKIDKIITNPAPPGQLVIIQGDGLDATHKLLFGSEPVPFKINSAGSVEAEVPHGSGTVEVTVEPEDGNKSNSVSFTFLEVS